MKNLFILILALIVLTISGCTIGSTSSNKEQPINIEDYQAELQRQQIKPDNSTSTTSLGPTNSGIDPIEQPVSSSVATVPSLATTTDYCKQKPTDTEIGGLVYPIEPQYTHLEYLGQMFTAYKCGIKRLKQVEGEDLRYTIGSVIELRNNPTADFQEILRAVGYHCYYKIVDSSCRKWILENEVDVSSLIRVEPFSASILKDDCIKCG
jgi:hypothetical protein